MASTYLAPMSRTIPLATYARLKPEVPFETHRRRAHAGIYGAIVRVPGRKRNAILLRVDELHRRELMPSREAMADRCVVLLVSLFRDWCPDAAARQLILERLSRALNMPSDSSGNGTHPQHAVTAAGVAADNGVPAEIEELPGDSPPKIR